MTKKEEKHEARLSFVMKEDEGEEEKNGINEAQV
jgi:hypothetical protein